MRPHATYLILAVLVLAPFARATPIIDVGNHVLQPDDPGQTIQVFVSGGDLVEGLNFNAQIADGGPEAGGAVRGPHITTADIVTGTIFANDNTGQRDPGSFPQIAIRRTTTNDDDTVMAQGLLATLAIDTTGFTSGTFPLKLGDTLNGPTNFAGVPAMITDGSISIVPEPTAPFIALSTAALLCLPRRSRRQRPLRTQK